jgi:hypothetical protein
MDFLVGKMNDDEVVDIGFLESSPPRGTWPDGNAFAVGMGFSTAAHGDQRRFIAFAL